MPRGSYTKAFLTTSVTEATGAGGAASSAMNVPLVAAGLQGMRGAVGIQIWSVEIEISAMAKATWVDTKYAEIILSQVPVTAAMQVNSRDVLWKTKIYCRLESAVGVFLTDLVRDKDFYPAIPFYGQQLHLGLINNTAASLTVYCKVWYSMVTLSQGELVQQLQNQLT